MSIFRNRQSSIPNLQSTIRKSVPPSLSRVKVSTILIGMPANKLTDLGRAKMIFAFPAFLVYGLAASGPAANGGDRPHLLTPVISETHRAFLSRVARRTLRDVVLGREMYEPVYVPGALSDLTIEVVVRLRQSGYLIASAAGGLKPIALATRDAAHAAGNTLLSSGATDLDQINDLLVEIEAVGRAEPIDVPKDWTQPRAVDPFIEPGVHGLALFGSRIQHRFCPTELLTNDLVLADALKRLAQTTHAKASEITDVRLMRFRTVHWYQPSHSDIIVSLQRGLTLVSSDAVSPKGLDESISRIAEYMAYRQLPSGLFTYQYEPGLDVYSEANNVVRQVGATLAMAVHAAWSGQTASRAAADVSIRYHLRGLTTIRDVDNAAFIATADGRNKLGLTALLALAMAECPDARQHETVRKKLVNGMLWLQRPSGMFMTAFPPAWEVSAQDYFPGEALLALAAQYDHNPGPRILDAFDRAAAFYREYFRSAPSPAFVPWQVQAYALIARHSKRKDYAEYVFELTDWLAAKQLNESNCEWPEMWGGIASYSDGRAGVATAAYLEGFADALVLARSVGDTRRSRRYEKVVRAAARFVMQLQVRPEETYFIRSPQDAIGGIRTSPFLNLLRIDHCQHALVGLIKARRALFPDRG